MHIIRCIWYAAYAPLVTVWSYTDGNSCYVAHMIECGPPQNLRRLFKIIVIFTKSDNELALENTRCLNSSRIDWKDLSRRWIRWFIHFGDHLFRTDCLTELFHFNINSIIFLRENNYFQMVCDCCNNWAKRVDHLIQQLRFWLSCKNLSFSNIVSFVNQY